MEHFEYLPDDQIRVMASFYSRIGNIYLVELQYDRNTNQIFPPV